MSTEQNARDLLTTGDEALVEAGFRTGDFGAARDLLEAARQQAERSGDAAVRAGALDRLGMLAHYENLTVLMSGSQLTADASDAEERLFRQALAGWQELGEPTASAQSLFGLGLVFQVLRQDWMAAMPYYWQALGLISDPGASPDLYLRSEVHRHIGFYFLFEDVQPAEALRHLQISLDLRQELGDERRIPSAQIALAQAKTAMGSHDEAVDLLTRAVAGAREARLAKQRIDMAEQSLREAEAAAAAAESGADATTATTASADATTASADATTAAEAPSGETPDSEAPAGETPDSEAPAGETPDSEAPAAETPAAEADQPSNDDAAGGDEPGDRDQPESDQPSG